MARRGAISKKARARGLAVARIAAHITYISDEALHRKFGRNLQNRDKIAFGFDADFQVDCYLPHQGISFVGRFDANSYLYRTRRDGLWTLRPIMAECSAISSRSRRRFS
jgi:homoserine O-acetyltransferase